MGLKFNSEGFLVDQLLKFRLGDSNFFAGGEWEFSSLDTRFDIGNDIPGIDPIEFDAKTSALGIVASYDSRDTIFTPSTGSAAEVRVQVYDDVIGSDFDFTRVRAYWHGFWQAHPSFVLGFRADGRFADGDIPFYMVPFIDLRGIPALRYQGETVLVGEAEARWAVYRDRVSLLSFLGVGKAADSISDIGSAPSRLAGGFGLRYFLAKKLGMHAGIDFAWGPEDFAWYLQVGQAWR